MKRILTLYLLSLCLALLPTAWADEPRLVLVAGVQSRVSDLTPAAVRRLYLGLPVSQEGHEIVPLRNIAEPEIQEIFLQRVLFMSSQAYERQASTRISRTGGSRLREYEDMQRLVFVLTNEPWTVAYMSLESAAAQPGLKIVAGL